MKFLIIILLISCISARPSTDVRYVGLRQLGKYSGVNDEGTAYQKTYFVSSFLKMTPPAARSYCKSFGPNMDLVSFETRNEFMVVRSKLEPEVRNRSIFVIVGSFAHASSASEAHFHWISSGARIFYDILVPAEKMCLGIRKERNDPVGFVPVSCDEKLKFMCQEMDIQYAN